MLIQFEWRNRDSWLPIVERFGSHPNNRLVVGKFIRKHYDSILVYHACRPRNVQSYYEKGLCTADHRLIDDDARRLFFSTEFPELTQEMIEKAINDVSGIDNHLAYVSLDDSLFCDEAGHYLIYGSERITAIAAALTGRTGRNYQKTLMRFGIPTVFRLTLPISQITYSDFEEFIRNIIVELPYVVAGNVPGVIDFTFCLHSSLEPRCVLSHYCPVEIKDPLTGFVAHPVNTKK